ncbi:MAG TPA: branched-chain amino acid ABC transporter substrate-binding protein [Ktedonobacteraceae bacterium]|nr:branched-chain amino acid ABC transporter substrate-binding protein [Ktedonobacteraceae bacterium]
MIKRSWIRIFVLAMGIPLLLTMLVACGSGTSTTGSSTPTGPITIKIATELPVSGKDTSDGKPPEDGVHLAIDEANASNALPGYRLQLLPKDDVGLNGSHDPSIGKQNVSALIDDAQVAGIVGPLNSSVAQAEMPIANQAPIALISPANTNPCLTKDTADVGCNGHNDLLPVLRSTGKVTYFRVATTDDHQGPANADYLYNTQHYRKVYIIDDAEAYGIGIANTFGAEWRKIGGTVLGHSSEPGTTSSYVSLLTVIASTHPDLIYFGGTTGTGGPLVRLQMEQVPALKDTAFAGGDGIVDTSFASTIGLTGGPVYATVATVNANKVPAAASFISKYQSVYGPLGSYSAAGYDCAKILIQAIKTALANGAHPAQNSGDAAATRSFRQAVIDALKNTNYDGVTGHQSFDANGDTTNKVISIYKLAANASGKPDWVYQTAVTVQ